MMRDNNLGDRMTNPSAGHSGQSHNDIVPPTVRTAWDVIEEACIARITGEMTLTTGSPHKTRVYITNGLVYFAEHDADESLASRLVLAGALDVDQLHRGSIRLNGTEHLGRLFERDTTIDRDAVELAVELITEQTLTDVAEEPVASYRTAIYRHHPSGIARWFSSHQSSEEEAPAVAPRTAEIETPTKPALSLVPPAADDTGEIELVTQPEPELEAFHEPAVDEIVADETSEDETVAEDIAVEPVIVAEDIAVEPITVDEDIAVEAVIADRTADDLVTEDLVAEDVAIEDIVVDDVVAEQVVAEAAPFVPVDEPFEPTVTWPMYADTVAVVPDETFADVAAPVAHLDEASFFAVAPDVEPLVAELAAWSTALPTSPQAVVPPDLAADVWVADRVAEHHASEAAITETADAESETVAEPVATELVVTASPDTFDTFEAEPERVEPETVEVVADIEWVEAVEAVEPLQTAEPVEVVAPVEAERTDLPTWDLVADVAAQLGFEPQPSDISPLTGPADEAPAVEAVVPAPVIEPTVTAPSWDAPAAVAETEPETLAPAAVAPTAPAFGIPTLPTTSKPVMRISHQSAAERSAPTVLSNARPEVAFDPNGPRLPGMVVPEPVVEPAPEPVAVVEAEPVAAPPVAPAAPAVEDLAALAAAIAAQAAPQQPAPASPPVAAVATPTTGLQPLANLTSLTSLVSMTSAAAMSAPTPAPAPAPVAPEASASGPAPAFLDATPAAPAPAPQPSTLTSLGSLGSLTSLTSLSGLAPLASMIPTESTNGFTPLASAATTATFTSDAAAPAAPAPAPVPVSTVAPVATPAPAASPMPVAAPTPTAVPAGLVAMPVGANPTAPPNHVPDFGSIPVPEDVAAAVRRAITAIEAATATPTTMAPVTFGPMHVTGAGRPEPFSFEDATRNLALFADEHTQTGSVPVVAAPDPMPSFSPFNAVGGAGGLSGISNGGLTGLQASGDAPAAVLDNPVAAPISTERRGALRRLIDGIRRRS